MDMRSLIAIVEMAQDTVYNWTQPIKLYRGSWRGNPDAFNDTKRGYPTFTDVFEVAEGYAEYANDGGHLSTNGKVFAYMVAPKSPLLMWGSDSPESVTEVGDLKRALGMSNQEMIEFLRTGHVEFRRDGEWVDLSDFDDEFLIRVLNSERNDPFLYDNAIYTDSYHLADNAYIQERAKAAGYDCMILRGHYNREVNFVNDDENSYDFDGALEWKPLDPSIVRLIGEVSRKDLTRAPETPVEAFMQEWRTETTSNGPGRSRNYNSAFVELMPFNLDQAGTVHIASIQSHYKGIGKASAALQAICALADKTGVKLTLTPKAFDDGKKSSPRLVAPLTDDQLRSWYERHGFVMGTQNVMTRKPKTTLKLGDRMKIVPMSGHSLGT